MLDDIAAGAVEVFDNWAAARMKRAQRKMIDMPEEQVAKMEEAAYLGHFMLEGYFKWCREVDNFKTIAVEHTFELPLKLNGKTLIVDTPQGKAEIWIKGKIDGIVQTPDGSFWLLEHKTMASIVTEYYTLYDEQSGVYTYGAQETLGALLGEEKRISGVLYNMLRKKLPTVPEELKRGGLTQRKNISTTYDVYMAEIRRIGDNPADYIEILQMLKDKGNRFYKREPIFRTQEEIREIILRLYYIAQDIFNNPIWYPNPDFFRCKMCSFQTVCVAMSAGADWKYILETKYETRQEEEEMIEVIEDPFELLETAE